MSEPKEIHEIKKELPEVGVEYGVTGTDIFSGYIDIDYNLEWRGILRKCRTIEQMRLGDPTVNAILESYKNPLLKSSFYIEGEDEEDKYFIRECLFEKINFYEFLTNALFYFDYGFSLFEKNFVIENGKIVWKNFLFLEQEKLEKWGIGANEWENGHPTGITQRTDGTDDSGATIGNPEIPWSKLIVLTKDKKGNNFEGESVLRKIYKNWKIKDTLEKIGAISADRFGVGIPYAKVNEKCSKEMRSDIVQFLRNVRANEQVHFLYDSGIDEWGIKMPEGASGMSSVIIEQIKFHDKKMLDAHNLGFLNLTSGEGGSNALSKDQSSFFLNNLQKEANYILRKIQEVIDELCEMNKLKTKPQIKCTDIGSISLDEFISSVSTAIGSGAVGNWSKRDSAKVREQLRLPEEEDPEEEIDDEAGGDEEDVDIEEEEAEIDEEIADLEDEMTEFEEDFEENFLVSEETKRKISEALKAYWRRKGVKKDDPKEGRDPKREIEIEKISKERNIEALNKASDHISEKIKATKDKAEKAKLREIKKNIVGRKRELRDEMRAKIKEARAEIKRQKEEKKNKKQKIKEERDKKVSAIDAKIESVSSQIEKLTDSLDGLSKSQKKKIKEEIKKLRDSKKVFRNDKKLLKKTYKDKLDFEEFAEKKRVRVSQREIVFQKNISDFENYLASEFANIQGIVEEAETRLDDKILKLYEGLETERKNGVQIISQSSKNNEIFKKAKEEVGKTKNFLESKLLDSPIQRRLFDNARKMSLKTVQDDEEILREKESKFAEMKVNEGKFKSFISGYTSNVGGVIFNEPRRYEEVIMEHKGGGISIDFAKSQIAEKQFNKNTLSLSVVSHPRGAFNAVLKDLNDQRGIQYYKVIVPKNKLKTLDSSGTTSSLLFRIFTAYALLEVLNKDKATADPMSGLNIHHGGFVYFYPITDPVLEEEEEIAKEQRAEFLENIQ